MFVEDKTIYQRHGERPRRFFTDNQHFDLYVWYVDEQRTEINGFQLVYRENPFDTDHEYFISRFPSDSDNVRSLGQTDSTYTTHAAPKVIKKTQNPPPECLFDLFQQAKVSLPVEIVEYCEPFIEAQRPH